MLNRKFDRFHWWFVRVNFVIGFGFLPQLFGEVVGMNAVFFSVNADWVVVLLRVGENTSTLHAVIKLVRIFYTRRWYQPTTLYGLCPLHFLNSKGMQRLVLRLVQRLEQRMWRVQRVGRLVQRCKGFEGSEGLFPFWTSFLDMMLNTLMPDPNVTPDTSAGYGTRYISTGYFTLVLSFIFMSWNIFACCNFVKSEREYKSKVSGIYVVQHWYPRRYKNPETFSLVTFLIGLIVWFSICLHCWNPLSVLYTMPCLVFCDSASSLTFSGLRLEKMLAVCKFVMAMCLYK